MVIATFRMYTFLALFAIFWCVGRDVERALGIGQKGDYCDSTRQTDKALRNVSHYGRLI